MEKTIRTKTLIYCLITLISITKIEAKENTNKEKKETPVAMTFWGPRLVDQQTTETTREGKFRVEILHRFGSLDNGIDELFGVYSSSNISMGVAYGITKKLEVEFQTEKKNKIQELGFKYKLLQQTFSNPYSVNLSFYSNVSIDTHEEEFFGDSYKFNDRLIYTNQLLISKQFKYKWAAMLSLAYVHFNNTPQSLNNDKMDLNLAMGYKINRTNSIFASCQIPWDVKWIEEVENRTGEPKTALNLGYEVSTYRHNFQIFISTRDNISVAKDLLYNQDKIELKNFKIGFNIRVKIGGNK